MRTPSIERLLHTAPRAALPALAAALLAGCAGFSSDGGFGAVQRLSAAHTPHELRWARSDDDRRAIDARVAELLAQPLSADAAVQLALLNNRGLQAAFHELGIREAEFVQAGRLPNPGFSFGRSRRGDEREIERGLHLNLAGWLTAPLAQAQQRRAFEQAQGQAALQVLTLAADTRKAHVQAVAAAQSLQYARQVADAAEAGAELARRMAQVGNFNALQRAREESFHAEALLGVAQAEQQARATRERLVRLLGLWGTQAELKLPERLADLPAAPVDRPDAEQRAIAQRLDVQGARLAVEQTARALGLTRTTRFVNVLELGLSHNSSNEEPTQRGWEVSFELPLFDWGDARVARAESVYRQALDQAAQTAVDARSEVREAYAAYRSAWDVARHHREQIVPLRQRIAEENLLRYNGMLIGVFELLADARVQIASVNAAIAAQRDFWLAEADLDLALIGKPRLAAAALGAQAATAAADGGGH